MKPVRYFANDDESFLARHYFYLMMSYEVQSKTSPSIAYTDEIYTSSARECDIYMSKEYVLRFFSRILQGDFIITAAIIQWINLSIIHIYLTIIYIYDDLIMGYHIGSWCILTLGYYKSSRYELILDYYRGNQISGYRIITYFVTISFVYYLHTWLNPVKRAVFLMVLSFLHMLSI